MQVRQHIFGVIGHPLVQRKTVAQHLDQLLRDGRAHQPQARAAGQQYDKRGQFARARNLTFLARLIQALLRGLFRFFEIAIFSHDRNTPLIMAIIGNRGKFKTGNKAVFTAYFIILQHWWVGRTLDDGCADKIMTG